MNGRYPLYQNNLFVALITEIVLVVNPISHVPAWRESIYSVHNHLNHSCLICSDLKRTESMAGGMLLTYAYLHALMCRRISTARSEL
ncbi:unnamed protein product [Schistosoma margrebowiei]|uniref:Uncharacterized protein n=1 Tax=Schistosoma margrebowiei TaxID=48269 RepID=A0AA84ZJC9_9TREM|nr:unnamed protein product [Schistosoma margrebowiei]